MSTSGIAIRAFQAGRLALGLAIIGGGGMTWAADSTSTAKRIGGPEPSRNEWTPAAPTNPRANRAISPQGGQGRAPTSARAYFGLTPRERLQVQAFLKSLAASADVPAYSRHGAFLRPDPL